MKKLALAAALLVLACSRGETPAPQHTSAPPGPPPPNLLELTRGAAVVSRTGEATLRASAVRAIDGDDSTPWVNPPENLQQTLTFSLPARSLIERVGVVTAGKPPNFVKSARFELSEDGVEFHEVGTFPFTPKEGAQLNPIKAATASFLRVTTLDGGSPTYAQLNTVYAAGSQLAPAPARSLDGCWSVVGSLASIAQKGAYVRGYVSAPERIFIEGGNDGRFFRFAWIRENTPEFGLGLISLTPDSKHLSGIVWHEEAIQAIQFLADDWIGERATCGKLAPSSSPVLKTYLDRFGYFPLYGLRFDDKGRLDENESAAMLDQIVPQLKGEYRFVAHEFLLPNPDVISQTKLDTLRAALQKRGVDVTRVPFVSMGTREPRREVNHDLTRAMYGSVELQVRR